MIQTVNLALSSFSLACLFASTGWTEFVPDLACIFAGIFGGAIMQLWTIDQRRPTKKVIIADLLSSGVSGFAAHVVSMATTTGTEPLVGSTVDVSFKITLLAAVIAGTGGSATFRALIVKFKPDWMYVENDEPN